MHCSRSRPRGVLKYRLKIRVSIYLFLSVGRKMTPLPETVSDPYTCQSLWVAGRRDSTVFGVVDDTTTTKFANRPCAVHGISLPVVVDKVVVVVLKFPIAFVLGLGLLFVPLSQPIV